MEIGDFVIPWIEIDMVNDLALGGAHNFSMLPLPPVSFGSIAKSLIPSRGGNVGFMNSLNRRVGLWCRLLEFRHWADGAILSTAQSHAMGEAAFLLFVGI